MKNKCYIGLYVIAIFLQTSYCALSDELNGLTTALKNLEVSLKDSRPKQSLQLNKQSFEPSRIWFELAEGKTLNRSEKLNIFVADSQRLATENTKIPQNNVSKVRIATYNVHYWTDPFEKLNYDGIYSVIKQLDADILILQEVNLGKNSFGSPDKETFYENMRAFGYKINSDDIFCKGANIYFAPFGNIIFSRYGYETVRSVVYKNNYGGEKRCFVNAKIKLPNGQWISVYGTHLDVFDQSGATRFKQVDELLQEVSDDQTTNKLIAADFNEVRQKDYDYAIKGKLVWDLLVNDNKKRNDPTSTSALNLLAQNGYVDSFSKAGIQGPKFSVWSGTVVDFLLLNKTWNLPITGSYVYFSAASDHIPIVMDIAIQPRRMSM